jgi:hypothetical protein
VSEGTAKPTLSDLDGVTGIGASYDREEDQWDLYTMPGVKPLGVVVKGYNRRMLDWIVDSLRTALAEANESGPNDRNSDGDSDSREGAIG